MKDVRVHLNAERIGILLAVLAGVFLFVNGLRFVVFGTLLTTIMPSSGLILVLAGIVLGLSLFIGMLVYWKFRIPGIPIVLIAAMWGVLLSGAFFIGPLLGVASSIILLYTNRSSIQRKRMFAIVCIILVSLLPLILLVESQARDYQILNVNGLERQYLLNIPEIYDGLEPVPLLIALHGGGGDASSMRRMYGFDDVSNKYGFIIVYPDGTGDMRYSLHTWNSGYADVYALRNGIDDVQFINALIIFIENHYNINSSAIYMTGHSNGAMMTYRFGAEHPEMLAGIAPVSGSVGGRMTEDSDFYIIPEPHLPLSVLHIHGELDEQVLYNGGKGDKGFLVDRVDLSANDSVVFWIENNNCSTLPSHKLSENGRIEERRYTGGMNDTEVHLITLIHGSHSWLNMTTEVSMEASYGMSMAEMIWIALMDM